MQIVQLEHPHDPDESYLASLDEMEADPPTTAKVDETNAEGIATIVEESRLGKEGFAARYCRIYRVRYVTAALLERWMTGAARPTLREARRIYLMARPAAKAKVAKHLSRATSLAFGLLLAFQLVDAALQLD